MHRVPGMDIDTLHRNWRFAVHTAMVSSVLAATLGAALHRFLGVGDGALLVATAALGLLTGLTLPPALPRRRAGRVVA